ncbi:MAG: hypothetical protein JRN15_13390 [Nitrososphaerota archaeon]|nr:hypothetical protein [Nitrososphaerota archaeon]
MLDARSSPANKWDSAPLYSRNLVMTGQNEFRRLAVLDTSHVRTGLHYQLKNGRPPAMIGLAETGAIGLFMELETLTETVEKLPKFANQLAKDFTVDENILKEVLKEDWLPHIRVVRLPEDLRELDSRAVKVRDLDSEDFPTAALASILSPCILLTGNSQHFYPLGVTDFDHGRKAIIAVGDGESNRIMLSTIETGTGLAITTPVEVGKWLYKKSGYKGLLIASGLILAALYFYRKQPQSKRETALYYLNQTFQFTYHMWTQAEAMITNAEARLEALSVPPPQQRSQLADVIRTLALAPDSMSAQAIHNTLAGQKRPKVVEIRKFLHDNKNGLFWEIRRGSFVVGRYYTIPDIGKELH